MRHLPCSGHACPRIGFAPSVASLPVSRTIDTSADQADRLIPLVFVGAWDSGSEADQAILDDHLLALDQIVNTAATLLHMSGGQLNVPVVIRMTTWLNYVFM